MRVFKKINYEEKKKKKPNKSSIELGFGSKGVMVIPELVRASGVLNSSQLRAFLPKSLLFPIPYQPLTLSLSLKTPNQNPNPNSTRLSATATSTLVFCAILRTPLNPNSSFLIFSAISIILNFSLLIDNVQGLSPNSLRASVIWGCFMFKLPQLFKFGFHLFIYLS